MELITLTSIGVIIGIFFLIYIIFLWTIRKDIIKKKEELILKEMEKCKPKIDFTTGQKAMDYLDRLIKDKYQYYLYARFLPVYLDRKIPEKNIVNEIKEKIYVTVVGGLTQDVKQEILKYFTQKGIEIYINEKIMVYMNETDFKTAEKYYETFRDMRPELMEKITP